MSGPEEDAKVPGGQKSQVGDAGWTLVVVNERQERGGAQTYGQELGGHR